MSVSETVTALVAPLLRDLGLEIYDFELGPGFVRITVDRPGGVDLDALSVATRVVSRELDHHDPIPTRYTLEVTSPGLERTLRTPAHFQRALGAMVSVRTHPGVEGDRRVHGPLVAADDEGITVKPAGEGAASPPPGGDETEVERHLRYEDIERARTVFEWTGTPKPGTTKSGSHRKARAS